jgi:pyridoxal phosphate enzyme (YggS family)
MSSIAENIHQVRQQISNSAARHQRDAADITLLAVSKTKPATDLREAYQQGQRDFGENYLQESLEKIEALSDLDICWHFIGPLQSNKTRPVAEHFDWLHTVDRLKIAERLSAQRPATRPPLNLCIQVNISNEANKSGCLPADVAELVAAIEKLPNVTVRGLMAIPKATTDTTEQHHQFAAMKTLLTTLQLKHPQIDTLSMGMSGDMDAAIAEGATIVRIGTAIFGARPAKD